MLNDEQEELQNKERQKALQVYGVMLASVVLNLVPVSAIQTFAMLLFFVVLVAIYIFRAKEEKGSFIHSHMAYIITSIWVSSLFLAVGMGAAFIFADHSIINDTVDSIMQGTMITEDDMKSILIDYLMANAIIFILTLGPSIFYLFYRFAKGMKYANEHLAMTGLKGWF